MLILSGLVELTIFTRIYRQRQRVNCRIAGTDAPLKRIMNPYGGLEC